MSNNKMSGTCKAALLVALFELVLIVWLNTVASQFEQERDTAEAALGAALTVLNTLSSAEGADKVCPAWLFETNAIDARKRICKGYK